PPTGVIESLLWRSPQASNTHGASTQEEREGHCVGLQDQVRWWPTPRASEWKGTGPPGSKSQATRLKARRLDAVVQEAETSSTDVWSGGKLNPEWEGWLMGYPAGWSRLEDTGTP
ncbi:hypothetical protein LCGC14_1019710, partial [marine sediment metagenome]